MIKLYRIKFISHHFVYQYNEFNKGMIKSGYYFNSENSKTSEPYRLLLNLEDKISLKRCDKFVALSNLSM